MREIAQLDGKTYAVPLNAGAPSLVTFEYLPAQGLSFRVHGEAESHIYCFDHVWHKLAALWNKKCVEVPSHGSASIAEMCFAHLLSMLPSLDFSGDALTLRNKIHLARKRPFIVILDDDETFRDVISSILGEEGMDVKGFCYKDEFLRQLSFLQPDLIITDIAAPRMTGLEFLEKTQI